MKIIAVMVAMLIAAGLYAVEPQTLSITNLRDEAEGYASTVEYARGYPLLLSNCAAHSGASTSSAREDLTDVQIVVKIGIPATNITYYGTAMVATNGTWWCLITTVPTNWDKPSISVSLTNTFTYPLKTLKTFQGL